MSALSLDRGSSWLRTSTAVSVLDDIHWPGVEVSIWQRRLPPSLSWWLERLSVGQLPDGRVLCRPGDLRQAVAALMRPTTPLGPMEDILLDDIVALGEIFVRLSRNELLDVRLERVDDDGCAAFHRDCVNFRLLTTYLGPGTQWIAPPDACRALSMQRAFDGPIEQFPHHAVGVVRGCQASEAQGLVHRSPPIEGTSQVRLLLCLNEPSATSPELWGS